MVDERALLLYKATMAIVKKMLAEGLISDKEYAAIETKTAEKYGFSLSVIFR